MKNLSYLETLAGFYSNSAFRALVARHGLVAACKTVYCRAVRNGNISRLSGRETAALLSVIRSAADAEGGAQ